MNKKFIPLFAPKKYCSWPPSDNIKNISNTLDIRLLENDSSDWEIVLLPDGSPVMRRSIKNWEGS